MKPLLVVFFVYFYLISFSYLFPAQKKQKRHLKKQESVLITDSAGQLIKQNGSIESP